VPFGFSPNSLAVTLAFLSSIKISLIFLLIAKEIAALSPFPKFSDRFFNAKTFSNSDELVDYLKQNPVKNATILIKGSRGIKLEKVIEVL